MITLLTNLSIQFLTELYLSPIAMLRFSLLIPYRTKSILFKDSLLWAPLIALNDRSHGVDLLIVFSDPTST